MKHENKKAITKPRIFVDMDGTLAEWRHTASLEEVMRQGYFQCLAPQQNILYAIKQVVADGRCEVFILSAYFFECRWARREKRRWLDEWLPEVDEAHRIFVPCGVNKSNAVPGDICPTDILLDDYSENLHAWYGIGVKCMTRQNGTKGTWTGEKLSANSSPDIIAAKLLRIAGVLTVKKESAGQPFHCEFITRECLSGTRIAVVQTADELITLLESFNCFTCESERQWLRGWLQTGINSSRFLRDAVFCQSRAIGDDGIHFLLKGTRI